MSTKARQLGVCSLQFTPLKRRAYLSRLAEVRDPWGARVFTAAELGIFGDHFPVGALIGADSAAAEDSLKSDLQQTGFSLLEVSCHPRLMGLNGFPMHNGHRAFIGEDIWASKSDGSPDYATIKARTKDEAPRIFQAAAKMGVKKVNTFIGSCRDGLEGKQFPELPHDQRQELLGLEATSYLELCDMAADAGLDSLNLEQHPGEPALDVEQMIEWGKLVGHHRCAGWKLDPSHWGMIGIDGAAGVLALVDAGLGHLIKAVHLKGGRLRLNGRASTKSTLGLNDPRRASRFVAIHLMDNATAYWTDFVDALNRAGFPADAGLFIEHEDDRLGSLALDSIEPALNSCATAGQFAYAHLLFLSPKGGHQENMQ